MRTITLGERIVKKKEGALSYYAKSKKAKCFFVMLCKRLGFFGGKVNRSYENV